MGLTYTDPADPQRFWGPLAKCFTVDDLNALPAGTQVWATNLEGTGWGTPYTAQGNGRFWDWGNDYDVEANDISIPAYALPGHPFTPFIDLSSPIPWIEAQSAREREIAADALEDFADTLDDDEVSGCGDKARAAAAEYRADADG